MMYTYGSKMYISHIPHLLVQSSMKQIMYYLMRHEWHIRINKTLGRARDPRANGAWLNKLTE